MRVNDLVLAVLVLVGAALLLAASTTLPPVPGQKFGADVFPFVISLGLFGCGALVAIGALRNGPGALVTASWAAEPRAAARVGGTLALALFYILLAPYLGFVVTATLTLLGLFLLLRVPLLTGALAALISSLCIYFAFAHLLRVPLPRGLIEGLL